MKKMKSLVLAFAAVAGIGTMGAAPADAQTVPVYGGQVYSQPAAGTSVSQGAIDDLAYNVGVQTAYYRDGHGFTQGTASDGETLGLEFQLNGSNATVVRAYNLNDPNSAAQFQAAVDRSAVNDRYLADQEYRSQSRMYDYYEPSAYVICAPVVPIFGIGLIIGGWHAGYVPVYHQWDGFWGHDGHRHHEQNTVIYNNTTVIEQGRGGRHDVAVWQHQNQNNAPWQHQVQNNTPWQQEHRNNGVVNQQPVIQHPVIQHPVETAPVRHFEQRQVEAPRIVAPQVVPQQVAHPGTFDRGAMQRTDGGEKHVFNMPRGRVR